MENEVILEGSSKQLDLGRRLLKETEDIGAGVLSDLSKLTINKFFCNLLDKKDSSSLYRTFLTKGQVTVPCTSIFKYL